MIVAGRVEPEDGPGPAPDLRPDARAQVGRSRWASAPAAAACSTTTPIVQGVDHIVPGRHVPPRLPAAARDADRRDPQAARPDPEHQARRQPRSSRSSELETAAPAGAADLRHEGHAAMSDEKTPEAVPSSRRDQSPENLPAPTREVRQVGVRPGMFGARGTGDTSGYGGLVQPVVLPAAGASGPYGGWFDEVGRARSTPRLGGGGRRARRRARGRSTAARSPSTSAARTCRPSPRCSATTPPLRFEFCAGVTGVHYPDRHRRASCTRSTTCSR